MLNRITSCPPERSSRQKVRPLRSNIKQVKKVWARIQHAIHTKRPFTLFSFILSDPQILVQLHNHSSEAGNLTKQTFTPYQNLATPIPWESQKAYLSNKILSSNPQNYPSDKLDPKEFKRTRRWTCKKIEINTGDNLYPNWNSRKKPRTICQLGKKVKIESALSYKLSLKVKTEF
jgi:hypothetical protein